MQLGFNQRPMAQTDVKQQQLASTQQQQEEGEEEQETRCSARHYHFIEAGRKEEEQKEEGDLNMALASNGSLLNGVPSLKISSLSNQAHICL